MMRSSWDSCLVGAEGARLLQQAIDERGLAVVDVGDNGDIAYVLHIVNHRFGHNNKLTVATITR